CRTLGSDELQLLRALFDKESFDELPPVAVKENGLSSSEQEFLRLKKNGGRRLYAGNLHKLLWMNAWSLQNEIPHQRLESVFNELRENGDFELRYALKDKIKQLEVLSADDEHPVRYVAGEGGELRVLVKDEEENSGVVRNRQRDDNLRWHVLTDGRIGDVAE